MNGRASCPQCAAVVAPADRFCGSCGSCLMDIRRIAVPRTIDQTGPCADCGNNTFSDGYCTACGHARAAPDRDQAQLAGIVLVTDRGIEHTRNEDAAAAGLLGGRRAVVAAVSDGVSSSEQAQLASAAASTAGVDGMLTALAGGHDPRSAVLAGLAEAAKAAAHVGTSPMTAPSCTYTAVAVVPAEDGAAHVHVANIGDSRAYWLPETEVAQQLTVDDSLAQELMSRGLPEDSPAVQRGAHTLTRWLGADAEPLPSAAVSAQAVILTGPGSVLLCSDGLWNYLPGADQLARFCTGTDATAAALALVEFALAAGGQDNITVAVIPIGGQHEFT